MQQPASSPPLLLTPRLLVPRLHPMLIERKQALLDQLERGLEGKLTLISAPAGYGKTTLVRQWLQARRNQSPCAVAWVSFNAGDNDVLRFWHYVMTACQKLQADLAQSALPLLHQAQQAALEQSSLSDALTAFLNEMSRTQGRGILVLENYHLITMPQVHETLAFMLEHLPETLHLILVTRVTPPLPLARLRARHELQELRAADLRFSQEETQFFLRQALPFELSSVALSRLDRQVEGWATGLRLVALALQRSTSQQHAEDFLLTLSGRQKHLLEFFVTEVLDVQPLPIQHFLLQTSILNRLTGSLCDTVTGRIDSERLLATIVQANLFLQPLDGRQQWYRYHPLFAEAMQHEARRRLGEEALQTSYERASDWYEQQSMFTEAVSAALKARSFERAVTLMEKIVEPHYVSDLYEPNADGQWRGTCFRLLGIEQLLDGKLHAARKLFLDAVACYRDARQGFAMRSALVILGDIYQLQGELHLAAAVYREVLATVKGDSADRKHALLGLARLSYEWNVLDNAEQEAREALAAGERMGEETLQAQLILIRIQQARGKSEQALSELRRLLVHTPPQASRLLFRELEAEFARLSLARGDLVAAEHWEAWRTMQAGEIPRLQREQEELIVARLRLAQGQFDEALRLLTSWRVEAREQGRLKSELEIVLLTALVYDANTQQSQAACELQKAFLLAHAQGYVRLFLDEGEAMKSLLRAVLPTIGRNLPPSYVRNMRMVLLDKSQQQLERVVPSVIRVPTQGRLIDPLSPQEQKVLHLLAAGYSNSEIASALVVSINTVKTQVRSIFRKLNVKSRQQARTIVRKQQGFS